MCTIIWIFWDSFYIISVIYKKSNYISKPCIRDYFLLLLDFIFSICRCDCDLLFDMKKISYLQGLYKECYEWHMRRIRQVMWCTLWIVRFWWFLKIHKWRVSNNWDTTFFFTYTIGRYIFFLCFDCLVFLCYFCLEYTDFSIVFFIELFDYLSAIVINKNIYKHKIKMNFLYFM